VMASLVYSIDLVALTFAVVLAAAIVLLVSHLIPTLLTCCRQPWAAHAKNRGRALAAVDRVEAADRLGLAWTRTAMDGLPCGGKWHAGRRFLCSYAGFR
jgi:hypothetical protein